MENIKHQKINFGTNFTLESTTNMVLSKKPKSAIFGANSIFGKTDNIPSPY